MSLYDLGIFQGVQSAGDARIDLSFGDEGEMVTGPQKLSQWFLVAFLTEKGSINGDDEFGTDFMTRARQGVIRTDTDVELYFNLAVRDFLDYQAANLLVEEDDEILTQAELLSFTLQARELQMRIQLTTAAGTSREVVLPIRSVPT